MQNFRSRDKLQLQAHSAFKPALKRHIANMTEESVRKCVLRVATAKGSKSKVTLPKLKCLAKEDI